MKLDGIHHITAICGDPAANVAFYTRVLGQRLIKRTVNFDDPGTWHLYFADHTGSPGTVLTFFAHPGLHRGVPGSGEVAAISFAIPSGSSAYWEERLGRLGVAFENSAGRFGSSRLSLNDPDGMKIELVEAAESTPATPWSDSGVPAEYAAGAFLGAVFLERRAAPTLELMTGVMGATAGPTDGFWQRVHVGSGAQTAYIDINTDPSLGNGQVGAGSVHHIAWRVSDDEAQAVALQELNAAGCAVSPVRDRNYFHSIYFREPGGILFEIATDQPGFTIDEPLESLGSELKLPPQYEAHRAQIESVLPPLI